MRKVLYFVLAKLFEWLLPYIAIFLLEALPLIGVIYLLSLIQ